MNSGSRPSLHKLFHATLLTSLALLIPGCGDPRVPSARQVRDAFFTTIPPELGIEKFEVDTKPAGEKQAEVHIRGVLRAKEQFYAQARSNFEFAHPQLARIEKKLRATDEIGEMGVFGNSFQTYLQIKTPAQRRHHELVMEFNGLQRKFVETTVSPKDPITIEGIAAAVNEFGKWRIDGWQVESRPENIGFPKKQIEGAMELRSPEAEAAVARLAKSVEELPAQPTAK